MVLTEMIFAGVAPFSRPLDRWQWHISIFLGLVRAFLDKEAHKRRCFFHVGRDGHGDFVEKKVAKRSCRRED